MWGSLEAGAEVVECGERAREREREMERERERKRKREKNSLSLSEGLNPHFT